jgi:hypothetical protein
MFYDFTQDKDLESRPTTWSSLSKLVLPSSPIPPIDSPPPTTHIIHLASTLFADSNKDLPRYAEPFFNLIHELLSSSFSIGQMVTSNDGSNDDCIFSTSTLSTGIQQADQEIWDVLLHSPLSVQMGGMDDDLCRDIFSLCWRQDWKIRIESPAIYSFIVKNVVYCCLHVPDLQEQAYTYLSSLAEIHIPISVYFLIVEGLGVLSTKYYLYSNQSSQNLQTNIYEDLLSTLTKPSPAFTDLSVFDTDQLRQCLSLVLTTVCNNINNYVLTKSTLFTLISASQETTLATIRNAFAAIACITTILNPRDVIEIVLSALARRLDEGTCEELIWETLGNIALVTGDVGVYEEVLVLMLERGGRDFGQVWACLLIKR